MEKSRSRIPLRNYLGMLAFSTFIGGYIGGCIGGLKDYEQVILGEPVTQEIKRIGPVTFEPPQMHEGMKNGAYYGLLTGISTLALFGLAQRSKTFSKSLEESIE